MAEVISITKDGTTYALFFRKEISSGGAKFFTKDEDAFQVGVLERPAGYEVQPHQHPERPTEVRTVSEFLYIASGRVQVAVLDEQWTELGSAELSAGDFLLFLRGGHKLTMLEDTRMIEVKQGPFLGDSGAKIFQPKL
ncbi:hypothetical protein COU78_00685 [Candidatus Peregrinibacteria bacterium CG10_big_fil_rev_8_21_14_0_10_49_24]|nr:MAG: hypothetical protein COV83_00935 [Candidatus Peregrinibacteria bacterium CG11_big_fil_rev_8_21_14_0_20_49_14]PIR51470.1 MAG: hypothetical protein COU78_00685 [Candidatus Peregrinibacteria bacterium CG10_big_fil_rev_8_21_14_0_10_49_24]PJA67887.1 MAG: hypothetical protein CO157_02655 [Candidatus Peregrinibacteria bacterium CG_4_9_14_3_um_filter_49_12]